MCQELRLFIRERETAMHRSMSGREDVASFVHRRPARVAGRGPFVAFGNAKQKPKTKNQNEDETRRRGEHNVRASSHLYRHAVPGIHLIALTALSCISVVLGCDVLRSQTTHLASIAPDAANGKSALSPTPVSYTHLRAHET